MPDTGSVVAITGLPDRNACLAQARALAGHGHRPAALWLDVDRFQAINRTLGHAAGDEVLRELSRRIRAAAPPGSLPFNVGADEFVVLLPDADRARAEALARTLVAAIRKPLPLGTMLLHPSAGVGIALHEAGEDAAELLARADRAKHDAKEQGRGHVVFSGEERVLGLQGALLEREELQVEHDLHEALDGGMLQLHYQPIVRPDGSVEAAEALMRCTVNGRSTRPDVLVRVAEKTGLIQRLGEWSLVEAARYARHLHEAGMPTRIAVNLSAAQLRAPSFSESLQAAVTVAGIDAALLELEVTESLALSNTDDALNTAREVQANIEVCASLGNPLAIDDFGTGQSCLAKLKHLPASKLKLDRAFASELPGDRRTFAIVRFVAQLGREFGMTVVAEGVETAEQLECLWEAGIDAAQGYYFARPMPADAFTAWLRGRPR